MAMVGRAFVRFRPALTPEDDAALADLQARCLDLAAAVERFRDSFVVPPAGEVLAFERRTPVEIPLRAAGEMHAPLASDVIATRPPAKREDAARSVVPPAPPRLLVPTDEGDD